MGLGLAHSMAVSGSFAYLTAAQHSSGGGSWAFCFDLAALSHDVTSVVTSLPRFKWRERKL